MSTSGIYADIYSSFVSDTNLLPALPEITLTIRQKLRDPNCTNKVAADLLKSDPGLAAFIMRTSNSVRYMLRQPPGDIESAVLRLGLSATLNLATTYATSSMFSVSSPVLKKTLLKSYRNATKVAVISYFLAKKLPGFDPGKAMLAGLLQDIALPPLLTRLKNRPDIFNDKEKLLAAIDELSPLVNSLILELWGFDEEIIDVVRTRKQWHRNEKEELDLSDIVLVARWHSLMGTDEFSACPSFLDMPVFNKLPCGQLEADNSLKLLVESRQEIDELQQTLCVAA